MPDDMDTVNCACLMLTVTHVRNGKRESFPLEERPGASTHRVCDFARALVQLSVHHVRLPIPEGDSCPGILLVWDDSGKRPFTQQTVPCGIILQDFIIIHVILRFNNFRTTNGRGTTAYSSICSTFGMHVPESGMGVSYAGETLHSMYRVKTGQPGRRPDVRMKRI